MTITVRLDPATDRALSRLARERRRSKSELVRESIASLAGLTGSSRKPPTSAYELMKPYIGIIKTGKSPRDGDWRTQYTAHLRKKHFGENPR